MGALVEIGLWNAVGAAALALVAAALARLCRRPALAHVLWLLVLLKLVTPPLIPLSVPWPATGGAAAAAGEEPAAVAPVEADIPPEEMAEDGPPAASTLPDPDPPPTP